MSTQDPALTGLAREVEALTRRLDQADARRDEEVGRLERNLTEVASTLAEVAERAHAGAVATQPPSAGGEWNGGWLDLRDSNPTTTAAVLNGLSEWVARVYLQYHGSILPECWLWHGDVIEELLWLQAEWHSAYPQPTDKEPHPVPVPGARAAWHDRYRPGVADRLAHVARSCLLTSHPRPPRTAPVTDAIPGIAARWATGETTEPSPTDDHHLAAELQQKEESQR